MKIPFLPNTTAMDAVSGEIRYAPLVGSDEEPIDLELGEDGVWAVPE